MSVPSYIKLSPQMDMATLVNAMNQNFNQVQSQDRRKVITDEDGNDRIVLGKQDDGTYAVRVSLDGKDVDTASDDELVMNSDWNMWKIVHSGTNNGISGSTRRNSNITLDSNYIAYISDICIPIRNLKVPAASVFSFTAKPQVFVRQMTDKRDFNYTAVFYDNGSAKLEITYCYLIYGSYLVIRSIVRWRAGSVTINPTGEPFNNTYLYWEIANPTRAVPGGMGGGGAPTGQYVYYDSVTANPYTNSLQGYDQSFNDVILAPMTYSSLYSYTYQFNDTNMGYHFPNAYNLIPRPAIEIDN